MNDLRLSLAIRSIFGWRRRRNYSVFFIKGATWRITAGIVLKVDATQACIIASNPILCCNTTSPAAGLCHTQAQRHQSGICAIKTNKSLEGMPHMALGWVGYYYVHSHAPLPGTAPLSDPSGQGNARPYHPKSYLCGVMCLWPFRRPGRLVC